MAFYTQRGTQLSLCAICKQIILLHRGLLMYLTEVMHKDSVLLSSFVETIERGRATKKENETSGKKAAAYDQRNIKNGNNQKNEQRVRLFQANENSRKRTQHTHAHVRIKDFISHREIISEQQRNGAAAVFEEQTLSLSLSPRRNETQTI